jgi:hypothetical protein
MSMIGSDINYHKDLFPKCYNSTLSESLNWMFNNTKELKEKGVEK